MLATSNTATLSERLRPAANRQESQLSKTLMRSLPLQPRFLRKTSGQSRGSAELVRCPSSDSKACDQQCQQCQAEASPCSANVHCSSTAHVVVLVGCLNVLSGICICLLKQGDTGSSHGRCSISTHQAALPVQGCQQSKDQTSLACCRPPHWTALPAPHPTLTLCAYPPYCCHRHTLNSGPTPQRRVHWGGTTA